MNLDIEGLRAATPGCAVGIHLNHSGASLPPQEALTAIIEHLQREALDGPMEAAAHVTERIEGLRADTAALLGASADEIAFTSSASAAWGLPFAALPPLRHGDRVIVGRQEWSGNLATLQFAADRAGATIEVIPVQPDGSADAEALAAMIDDRVRLISLTWLPANGGLINDAAAIGQVARAAGIPYFVDAGQALGQLPIDVKALGCDVLKGAGRKFLRGPRGVALLYVRRSFLDRLQPAYLDVLSAPWTAHGPVMRQDARRFETSETAVALLLGLGAALKLAQALGIPAIRARIAALADGLRARLADIPGVTLRDLGTERSGLVSFTVEGMPAQAVRARLVAERIAIGANGIAYTPLDMAARGLDEIARASVSYFNTEEELDRLCRAAAALSAR